MKKSKFEDYEVGTTFEREGKTYKVVESRDGCDTCAFEDADHCMSVRCEGVRRADGVDVVFEEVHSDA